MEEPNVLQLFPTPGIELSLSRSISERRWWWLLKNIKVALALAAARAAHRAFLSPPTTDDDGCCCWLLAAVAAVVEGSGGGPSHHQTTTEFLPFWHGRGVASQDGVMLRRGRRNKEGESLFLPGESPPPTAVALPE